MQIPVVAIPVRCPKCGEAGLSEFPVAVVAIALVKWNNMYLYAPCHEGAWDASERELDSIRHYLGRDWVREHGQGILQPHVANVIFLDRVSREEKRKLSAGQVPTLLRGGVSGALPRLRQAREVN